MGTDLLNRPSPEEQPNNSQDELDLPISVEKPTQIKKAIRTFKNGKAAGPDGIPAEALKAQPQIYCIICLPKVGMKKKYQQTGEKDW